MDVKNQEKEKYISNYNGSVTSDIDFDDSDGKALPFIDRLENSSEYVKLYYNTIKNAIMSYEGISNFITKRYDTFKHSKRIVFKIAYVKTTLKLYLPLDSDDYPKELFPHKNMSDVIRHQYSPFEIKIRTNLAVKRALVLIGDSMLKLGLKKKNEEKPIDYIEFNKGLLK